MLRSPTWKIRVAAAFAVVYLVWGSTYLAIRIGVAELPPLLFAGSRFLAAGVLLALYALAAGQRPPRSAREWHLIVIVGLLLLAAANGLVVWGEQWVPSNQAALIAATTALWLAGLGTLGRHGHQLTRATLTGLLIGLAGVALLLLPRGFCWAAGSIYAKHRRPATPALMSAALQSLVAGAALVAGGFAAGEAGRWSWQATEALTALAYLIVFGSCLAYAAYLWLLHTVRPALLGTYAYVNPLVAVVLGGWLLEETLGSLQLLGMLVILLGVVLVSRASQRETAPAARN